MKLLTLVILCCFILIIASPCNSLPIYEDAFSSSQTYGDAEASGYAEVIPVSTNIPELQAASAAESTKGGRANQVDFAAYSQGYSIPFDQLQNVYPQLQFTPYQILPFFPQFNQYPDYQ
ncbi:uncharacterized protein Gasu_31500 [Galdieria sulphuraria]|uniref:Uncharacterized protein n=1 Tax=Galdieria sulphuraria TaxID=130081 RepID=M2XHF5_GALSU|nr:uncharacterized protein Gasu_31500 [Galdieria sulphuraria]EME29512.1 hypothetical protein Gasu_31500 [Galdieria sulphuraria]|eukprot:XP_005706032.1 hypothetical protein Gasu_31500 [Galdieria sulphuraria]